MPPVYVQISFLPPLPHLCQNLLRECFWNLEESYLRTAHLPRTLCNRFSHAIYMTVHAVKYDVYLHLSPILLAKKPPRYILYRGGHCSLARTVRRLLAASAAHTVFNRFTALLTWCTSARLTHKITSFICYTKVMPYNLRMSRRPEIQETTALCCGNVNPGTSNLTIIPKKGKDNSHIHQLINDIKE